MRVTVPRHRDHGRADGAQRARRRPRGEHVESLAREGRAARAGRRHGRRQRRRGGRGRRRRRDDAGRRAGREAVVAEALGALDGAAAGPDEHDRARATDRLAERVEAAGVAFVDAPVSGTKQPAERGKLVVLASGPEGVAGALTRCSTRSARSPCWPGQGRQVHSASSWSSTPGCSALTEALAEAIALAEGARGRPADVPGDDRRRRPIGAPLRPGQGAR